MGEESVEVTDGRIESGSWVYLWVRPSDGEVLYVGATALPPTARVWLHINHDDPDVARVKADAPAALSGDIVVRCFRIDPTLDRSAVRDALKARLESRCMGLEDGAHQVAAAILDQIGGSK